MTVRETVRDEEAPAEPNHLWQLLQRQVEAYVRAREERGQPPGLAEFLPAEPAGLRRLVLIELIKVDLDYRRRQLDQSRRVEDYLHDFPELGQNGVPCDLVYEEFHIRKRAGDSVDPTEYYRRFPGQADQLRRVLETAPTITSSLAASADPAGFKPGEQLDDFDLLTRLGAGAFATVFLARQRSMQRLVALKVSASRGAEPQTLAQLDHPNVVRVFDQRQLSGSNLSLMYMQYVPGGTLQQVIVREQAVPFGQRTGRLLLAVVDQALQHRGELPPGESALRQRLGAMGWAEVVCWVGARLAGALEHAHRQGILHRDVKPANVLLTAEGLPMLADFNVSCSSKLEGAGPAAFFGGSLAYMSPEQLEAFSPNHARRPDSLDGRTDIYSLGIVLWELLTGRRPFPDMDLGTQWSDMLEEMLQQRLAGLTLTAGTSLASVAPRLVGTGGSPVPEGGGDRRAARPYEARKMTVQTLPPTCPTGLEQVLLTCLAPEPECRFTSAGELAAQLELCLQPRTRDLLYPPARSWRWTMRRHALLFLLLAALLPNVLVAVFNFAYNAREIIPHLAGAEHTFMLIQGVINATAFPVGIGLYIWLCRPVAKAIGGRIAGTTPDQLATLRRECLGLAPRGAAICVGCWLSAGIAYPLSLSASLGTVPAWVFAHFLASLTLCGLMAAAYPFFAVAFLSVHALYPALVRPGAAVESDLRELKDLQWWVSFYLVVASSVPLLSMTAVALIRTGSPLLLGLLGLGGLVGFGVVFWLSREIQADLEALAYAVHPGREGRAL